MDWVHCNKCCYWPGQHPKRDFILTSCGHIFCKSCERATQVEHCKVCGASCTTTPVSSQMVEEVRNYFEDSESLLSKTLKVIEFQKAHRMKFIDSFKAMWEKYQKLKLAYMKVNEENKQLKNEIEKMKKGQSFMTPPPPSSNTPLFCRNSQESQFIRMQSQGNRRPDSPMFVTPTRIISSSQNYRNQNTPSTPMSDGSSVSPASVSPQQSFRGSQQRLYRPGLTPPLSRLSLLSIIPERARDSSSRF